MSYAGAPALLLVLIHRSAWKGNSANFALTEFYEVRSCAQSMEKDCPPSWISGRTLQGRGRQISNCCGPTPDVVHARPADHREGEGRRSSRPSLSSTIRSPKGIR